MEKFIWIYILVLLIISAFVLAYLPSIAKSAEMFNKDTAKLYKSVSRYDEAYAQKCAEQSVSKADAVKCFEQFYKRIGK